MNYLLYFKQIHEQLVVRKKFHINQKDIQNKNRYRMSQSYHNYPSKVNTCDAVNLFNLFDDFSCFNILGPFVEKKMFCTIFIFIFPIQNSLNAYETQPFYVSASLLDTNKKRENKLYQ